MFTKSVRTSGFERAAGPGRMVDIHAHILPDVDDGSQDLTDSLLMAELAAESGVSAIIATPHANLPWEDDTGRLPYLLEQYDLLKDALQQRGIPIDLYMGMEIYLTEDAAELIRMKELIPLNQTKRFLVEFNFEKSERLATTLIRRVCDIGAMPIIAHAERYRCVQENPSLVLKWREMGCQIQINKGSVFGSFGRRAGMAAMKLLQQGTVSYAASDAHSPFERNTYMGDIYEFLADEFSVDLAERLLVENPRKYLL